MVPGAQNIALVYIPVEILNFENITFHSLFSSLLHWSKCKIKNLYWLQVQYIKPVLAI